MADMLREELRAFLAPASNLALHEHIQQLQAAGRHVHHFGFGQSPFPVCPPLCTALANYSRHAAYLPVAGLPKLREAICAFHREHDRWGNTFDANRVIVGPGSKELTFLLMNVFQGDVLVVSPAWTSYSPQAQLARQRVHVIGTSATDQWCLTPPALLHALKDISSKHKLLIFCNPDNPTGIGYTAKQLLEIRLVDQPDKSAVCQQHGVIVLSDEIYGRLHYQGNHQSISKFYPSGTIVSAGFSKWASAGGWRLGYQLYPAALTELYEAVRAAASYTYTSAPTPQQYAALEALSHTQECETYIKHSTRILSALANYCVRELREVGVKVLQPDASYYMFPDFEVLRDALVRRGISTCEHMCQAMLDEANVAVLAGSAGFLRPSTELTVRLSFVNFDGAAALDASQTLGLEVSLDDKFVHQYCRPVCDGIQALKSWITTIQSGQKKLTDNLLHCEETLTLSPVKPWSIRLERV